MSKDEIIALIEADEMVKAWIALREFMKSDEPIGGNNETD